LFLTPRNGLPVFACRANAAAEAAETLVSVGSGELPFACLARCMDGFGVEMKAFNLPEDGAELDVVRTMPRDFSVESPVIEVKDCPLHGVE
jgi:hypothetical protein